jgi:invasion protein IalB
MCLTRGRKTPASARRRGLVPMIGAALAGAAILASGVGSGSTAAFAQATGDPPAAPQAPAPVAPGPRDGEVLQDWTLRCQLPQPGQEICEMRQRIVDEDGNRVVLAVVGRLPNIDVPGLLLMLPLGISLPPGTYLKIDQGEERRVPVERCESQGCRIELLLDNDLLPRLKAGSRATLGFHIYDGQGQRPRVDVPISLIGFSAALAEVMR